MENITLETIVQRLDRLEKIITEMNQQLSWIVEVIVHNTQNEFSRAIIAEREK